MRLTEGPIGRALVRLAWPVFVSRALHTLYGTADTAWVGRLGPEAIAAVSTCFFASWVIYSGGDILIAGVTALVSRSIGAGREDEAARAARTGFFLAIGLGAGFAVAGWTGAHPLFVLLFEDERIVRMGTEYLSLFSLLSPILVLGLVAEAVWRSCGNSRTPMNVVLVGSLLNIALDPFLILGIGPFPRLEVRGAAIATVISEVVVLLAYAILFWRGRFPLALFGPGRGPLVAWDRAAQILRIGLPHAAIGVLFSVVYLYLARLTGVHGAPALAALGIVNRLESLNYLTASAVGMGVAALVGQNLGAGRPDRAKRSAHLGVRYITLTTGIVTALFLFRAEWVVGIFTDDPGALEEGIRFLRIVAISQIFMGWELVYGHAFTGAGDTIPPMIVSGAVSALRIPMAWALSGPGGAGPVGIWWTISLTGIARGLILTVWFRRGGWLRKDLGIRRAVESGVGVPGMPTGPPLPGPDSPEG